MAARKQTLMPDYLPDDDIEDPDTLVDPVQNNLPTGQKFQCQPAYIEPEQQQMLDALGDNHDYFGLAEEIGRIEAVKAVSYHVSRLRGPIWKDRGVHLLAQRHIEVLKAVLNTTLAQRAQLDLWDKVRVPAQGPFNPKPELDAVIYVNILADREGKGLTCNEFEHFLAAMKRRFIASGRSLRAGINGNFGECRKGNGTKDFNQHIGKARLQAMEDHTNDFVKANEATLQRARDANSNHIMLKGEVGWTWCCRQRCYEHRTLTNSPEVLQLATMVLQHLYRPRGFKLHQFVLFDIVQEDEASVGESIGSQLFTSYATYGGFNVDQAGKSVNRAWQIDGGAWMDRRTQITNTELKYVLPNLEQMANSYLEQERSVKDRKCTEDALTELEATQKELATEEATSQRRTGRLQRVTQQAQAQVEEDEATIDAKYTGRLELAKAEEDGCEFRDELSALVKEFGCD